MAGAGKEKASVTDERENIAINGILKDEFPAEWVYASIGLISTTAGIGGGLGPIKAV